MATAAARATAGALTSVPFPLACSTSSSSSITSCSLGVGKRIAWGVSSSSRQQEQVWSSTRFGWGVLHQQCNAPPAGALQLVRALAQEAEQAESEVALEVEPAVIQDTVSLLFKAEGTLSDAGVPKLQKALEGQEGVSGVKVNVSDGSATAELTKTASIQDTGVASGLVEILQANGFKIQALNIGFDDENDDDDGLYEYDDTAAYAEEEEAAAEES